MAIPKHIPFMPWIKVPAATITCSGTASIRALDEMDPEIVETVTQEDPELRAHSIGIEVVPEGDFVTYGIGVSMIAMKDPTKARARAPVA